MKKRGWIKIYRSIEDDPLWKDEPFDKAHAWIDLILMANHEDRQLLIGNDYFLLKRGQFHTSESKLGNKWKWSRKKVRAYLDLLETMEKVTTVRTTKGTTITVENYNKYQTNGTTKDTTRVPSEDTAQEPRRVQRRNNEGLTNKNLKNYKNLKNLKSGGEDAPAHGHNVILTDHEIDLLEEEFGNGWPEYIEKLSAHMESTGKEYQSHYATIRKWMLEDKTGRRR